ncbi:beta-N-acetylglucosaminidase domain-containing protein [Gilvimarinus sp. DA14]|uniref:beta-N-acetylglucosaminidase domain-containing protein n=1 Tax=Gilvimarinus sp. DA14 TaxID=2956798 RepID=UPI0020B6E3C5|nr:beta-N-acetylglucosaminidase domain-containing protein [Gilvimarinus sp. DA14]UTF60430.1 protein O-GlcNAcase [Gilvimarinus sp. DA14]
MTQTAPPPIGILEGFFGRSWSWEQRQRLASFMRREGFDFYLYAPKSDRHLRSRWREHWPADDWLALQQLRATYRTAGISFGLGLSPLDLCSASGEADTDALDRKIKRINELDPNWLGLFFDDMRGDIPGLAKRQAELAHRAAQRSTAGTILLCPTYYSDDPVLDKVFGARPKGYLTQLGRELDPSIEIFWTGPKVCSETYPLAHLEATAHQLGRKPFLWDNYPVNDGAIKSKHLYLQPPEASRFHNRDAIAGIAANPMNQFALSLPALCALAQGVTQGGPTTLESALQHTLPHPLAVVLAQDADFFAQQGLNNLGDSERLRLLKRYEPLSEHEAAREIIAWLRGEYTFDPACLTE